MEFNPKNYHDLNFSNPELAALADQKNARNTRLELRSYGIDRTTINLLIKDGYRGSEEIYDAPTDRLLAIKGFGWKRLSLVRRALLPYYLRVLD